MSSVTGVPDIARPYWLRSALVSALWDRVMVPVLRAGNSIQGRLAMVLISILVLTSVLGVFAIHLATKALVDSYGYKTGQITSIVLREMDALVTARIGELALVATRPETAALLVEEAANRAQFGGVLGSEPWSQIDARGRSVQNTAHFIAAQLQALEQRVFGQPVYGDLVVADRNGTVLSTTSAAAAPVLADPELIGTALADGYALGAVGEHGAIGVSGWPIAVRLSDYQGQILGVLSTVVSSQWVAREAAARARSDFTVEVRLTDRNGRLIYSSLPFQFLQSIEHSPVYALAATPERYGVVTEGGLERLYAVGSLAPGSVLGNLGWQLFIGQDAASVLAPADQLGWTLMLLMTLLAVLVIAVVALAGHSLSQPLLGLRDVAERLKAGDRTARATVTTRTEIGDLAQSFNSMIDQLAASQARLEEEIDVRTQAQRESREQADFVRNVLDSLAQSAAVVDPAGKIVAVNRTWSALGTVDASSTGTRVISAAKSYFEPFDDAYCTTGLAVTAYHGIRRVQSWDLPGYELEYACGSAGDRRWYFMAVVPLKDRAGYVLITHTDVTDIKRAQVDLEVKNKRLGEEVQLRKSYEAALKAERDRSEDANRAKSAFLASMSHELRTPLNAIIGFSEVMREQVLGPMGNGRYLDYARNIHVSGVHLLSLINDLLDLSKIEAGKMELDEDVVRLPDLMAEVSTMMAERAAHQGLTLVCDPVADVTVWADRRKLKQVLINLVSNAIKFSPAGVPVTLSLTMSESGCPTMAVVDRGIGMSPADITKALTIFGQTESGKARGGTGLGLPLARQLMWLQGGDLVIDSRLNEGTSVTVTLPADRRRVVPASDTNDRLSA